MKKHLSTILIITFSLLFAFAFGTMSPANAADRDLVVSGGEEGTDYTYEDGVLTFLNNGDYTISMADGVDESSDSIILDVDSGLSSITITMDSVKMNTDGAHIISLSTIHSPSTPPLDLNLILQGDNSLTAAKDPYSIEENIVNLTISGSGSLTVESTGSGDYGMNGRSFTLESGTVILKNNQVRTDGGGIYIKGGSLNVTSRSEGLYSNTEYKQTGGTVEVTAATSGLFVPGFGQPEPVDGVQILGGDLTISGTGDRFNCINTGQYNKKNIIIDTDGTVQLNSSYLGIVLQKDSNLTMNGNLLKIDGPLIGIYPLSSGCEFHVNGGETEITSGLRAIDLRSASDKTINYSGDYFHKNYDGDAAASRAEVSDSDIMSDAGVSKKYVLITPAYKITYDLGIGHLPEGVSNPVKYSRVDEFTLNNPVSGQSSRPFIGWTGTDLDGLTMTVTIPEGSTGDRTYKANYKDVPKYTISYNPNGGSLNGHTGTVTETHEQGETIRIANAPTRSGYTFKYWTSQGKAYYPGRAYVVDGNCTFTAVWQKNDSGGGDSGGGSGTDSDDNRGGRNNGGNNGRGNGGNNGGNGVGTAANTGTNPAPTPKPSVISDPNPPTTITTEPTPKAAPEYWALINLLCAIATALLSIAMLIRYFRRRGGARLASLIPAVGAIVAFILTEDMRNPMIMTDKWTLLMIIILAVQAGVAVFANLRNSEDEEEEDA